MYEIPADLKLPGLNCSVLNQMCLGKYDVTFNFDCGISILAQGGVLFSKAGKVVSSWKQETGWDDLQYQGLLNREVMGFEVIGNKSLLIHFSEGAALRLTDTSDQYESIQISPMGYIF